MTRKPANTESTLPQKDAADARSKMRSSADWERIHVEQGLLQPGRVVGDECECAETDLAALNQNSAKNRDEGRRNDCNFSNKSLRHLPQGGRQLSWF